MNKKIRCLIVDDEVLAREGMRILAQNDPELQVSGECANGVQAIESILQKHPDLVFLDIQMPEMDGFAVLNHLKREKLPYIIFVTAYDKYAVQAFEVHALDYLLKPVDEERFGRAIERAKVTLRSESEWDHHLSGLLQELESARPCYLERVIIKEEGRIFFVKASEIDWIEAKGNYAMVHAGKKSHMIREAMTALENQLNPHKFFRIHRSTIVNIDRVSELQSLFHGDYRVLLQDGTSLLMSRRFRDKLKDHLSI
jgi:two-component system, LytTR family, response regulator